MSRLIINRILTAIPIVMGIVLATFVLMSVIPGSAATAMMGNKVNNAVIARVEEQMHLNDPVPKRFVLYVGGLLRGDLGTSLVMNQPVAQLVGNAFPVTLKLAASSVLFAWIFGIAVGIISGIRQNSAVDKLFMGVSMIGISMPTFAIALILQYTFAYRLKLLPISGMDGWRSFILPSIVLGWGNAGEVARLVRSNLISVMEEDYITTARAKGQTLPAIVVFQALKVSLLPVVNVMMLQFTSLLGGALITESIFGIPGIGTLTISALGNRDLPLLQGTIIISTMLIVVGNLVADIICLLLNPQAREE